MARLKDTTNIYLNEIDKIPSLSREEEKDVSDKIKQGDRQALSRLVKSNLKVCSIGQTLGIMYNS